MSDITIPRYAAIGGMALQFDGKQYVSCGHPEAFSITGSMTFEAWVCPTGCNPDQPFIILSNYEQLTGGGFGGYEAQIKSRKFVFLINPESSYNPDSEYQGKTELKEDWWYHLSAVYDQELKKLILYVNGNPDSEFTRNNPIAASKSPLFIGRRKGLEDNMYQGVLNQVRIRKYALSRNEIMTSMRRNYVGPNDPPGWKNDGLVSNWRCDEGYGDTAFDYSHGYNGILGGGDENAPAPAAVPKWVVSTAPSNFHFFSSL